MSWLTDRLDWLAAPWWALSDMQVQITRLQLDHLQLRSDMAKNKQALAELDAQIDELEAYVLSDDETDAAEVQNRVARLKSVLSQAKGEAPAGGEQAPVDGGAGQPADVVVNPTPGAEDNPNA